MAFASSGFELVVAFKDNGDDTVTRTYKFVDGIEYDDAVTAAAAFIATLDPLTNALISWYRIVNILDNDTQTLPADGVQNENQLILTVGILDKPHESATLTVPAPVIGAFVGTSGKAANQANVSASIITNFVGLFVDGGNFTLSDGDTAILTGLAGKRRHTKNSNG